MAHGCIRTTDTFVSNFIIEAVNRRIPVDFRCICLKDLGLEALGQAQHVEGPITLVFVVAQDRVDSGSAKPDRRGEDLVALDV